MDGWKYQTKTDNQLCQPSLTILLSDRMLQSITPLILFISQNIHAKFPLEKGLTTIQKFKDVNLAQKFLEQNDHILNVIVVTTNQFSQNVAESLGRFQSVKNVVLYTQNSKVGREKIQQYKNFKFTQLFTSFETLTQGLKNCLERVKKDISFFKRQNLKQSNLNLIRTLSMIQKKNRQQAKSDFYNLLKDIKQYPFIRKNLPYPDFQDNLERIQNYPKNYSSDIFENIIPFMKLINFILGLCQNTEELAQLRLLVSDAYYSIRQNYIRRQVVKKKIILEQKFYTFQKFTKAQISFFKQKIENNYVNKYICFKTFFRASKSDEQELREIIKSNKSGSQKYNTLIEIEVKHPLNEESIRIYEQYNHGYFFVKSGEIWFNLLNIFELVSVREGQFEGEDITIIRLKYGIPALLVRKHQNNEVLRAQQSVLMKSVFYHEGLTEKVQSFSDILRLENKLFEAYNHFSSEDNLCIQQKNFERRIKISFQKAKINILEGKYHEANKKYMQVIELFKEFSSNDNNIFLIGVKATLAYEKMTKKIKNVSIFTKTLLDYEEWITEKFPKVKDEKKFLALAALVELQEITKTNEKIYDNFREFFKKQSNQLMIAKYSEIAIDAALNVAQRLYEKKQHNQSYDVLQQCSKIIRETVGVQSFCYIKMASMKAYIYPGSENKLNYLRRLKQVYEAIKRKNDKNYRTVMRILNQEENRDYSLIENLVKENYEVAESFISVADDDSEINEHLPTEQQ